MGCWSRLSKYCSFALFGVRQSNISNLYVLDVFFFLSETRAIEQIKAAYRLFHHLLLPPSSPFLVPLRTSVGLRETFPFSVPIHVCVCVNCLPIEFDIEGCAPHHKPNIYGEWGQRSFLPESILDVHKAHTQIDRQVKNQNPFLILLAQIDGRFIVWTLHSLESGIF